MILVILLGIGILALFLLAAKCTTLDYNSSMWVGAASSATTQDEINAIAVAAANTVVAPQTSAPQNITAAQGAAISLNLLNKTSSASKPVFNTILGSQLTLSQTDSMNKYTSNNITTTAINPISANSNTNLSAVSATNGFDSRVQWPGLISSVLDQLQCGSCHAFSTCSMVSDRIRIHSSSGTNQTSLHLDQVTPGNSTYDETNIVSNGGKLLNNQVNIRGSNTLSQLSPWYFAGCDCCGFSFNLDPNISSIFTSRQLCSNCCAGGIIQYDLIWILLNGVVETTCTKALVDYSCSTQLGCPVFRVKNIYRVNPYTSQINDPNNPASPQILQQNAQAIMTEIATNGPISASMYVYPNLDTWNTEYVYDDLQGTTGPGGHAICIVGFGTGPNASGTIVPYWLIRNSWSTSWGNQGYFKILRGQNFCRIEGDCWTVTPFSVYNLSPIPATKNPLTSTASTLCSSVPSVAIVSPTPS